MKMVSLGVGTCKFDGSHLCILPPWLLWKVAFFVFWGSPHVTIILKWAIFRIKSLGTNLCIDPVRFQVGAPVAFSSAGRHDLKSVLELHVGLHSSMRKYSRILCIEISKQVIFFSIKTLSLKLQILVWRSFSQITWLMSVLALREHCKCYISIT